MTGKHSTSPLTALLLALAALALGTVPAEQAVAAGANPASAPHRILSLSASATQMLYAVGAGPQVVGVDKYSTYPPSAPRTKFTGAETSAEDYLYLHPDLVIFAYKTGSVVQQLNVLHIATLVLPPPSTLAGVDNQVALLGRVTGHARQAARAEAALGANLAAAVRDAHGAGRGKTYYVELDPTYYTATSKTFIGAEFALFGMRDVGDPAGRTTTYPQVSAEYLIKADPDYVFLADTVCCRVTAANFARRPGFSVLQAVKVHHVFGVNDSVASQWGPHTIEVLVEFLSRVLAS